MVSSQKPKVLVLSRNVWDDTKGTSSTLSNIFENYDPTKVAHVYIETIRPNTKCCQHFFQISEFSLVHKLYKWNTRTGHSIGVDSKNDNQDSQVAHQEAATMNYVRGHRSFLFSFLREILWGFGGWKSKELRSFVLDFDPDVIWIDGSPLPFLNKVYYYILRIAKKPSVIFIQDDIYTYESCIPRLSEYIYKWYLRRQVRRVIGKCNEMFVISPKMKKEYDKIFGFDSAIVTKSIDFSIVRFKPIEPHSPIRMVYMGQIIYGRIYSLIAIANALKTINSNGIKVQLSIYTNNKIPEDLKSKLLIKDSVVLCTPVPYSEVPSVISQNDVVVFVESLDSRYSRVARLSFSTKITDYLASNKCVLAIGPGNSAPIEYLKDQDAALVATNIEDIEKQILKLSSPGVIKEYAQKAYDCALRNHDKSTMDEKVYGKLLKLASF
jgi:hypothetical protein